MLFFIVMCYLLQGFRLILNFHDGLFIYIFTRLQHADAFELIDQHNLFSAVHDKILALMELDVNQACTLFLKHSDHITPDLVVSRLQTKPQLLYKVTCLTWLEVCFDDLRH